MNRALSELWLFLRVILNPVWWMRNHLTNRDWDRALRRAINGNPVVSNMNEYTVLINGVEVWISNYPYAYGSPRHTKALPSRRTALLLRQMQRERLAAGPNDYLSKACAQVQSSSA